MVGRDECIAGVGISPHKPLQRLSFQIARQQQAPAGRLHRQHQARLIIVARFRLCCGSLIFRIGFWIGVEHAHPAEIVEGQGIPGSHGLHRHSRGLRFPQKIGHGERVALQKGPGDDHFPHAEPFEEFGNRVKVVGVGMGDHQRIDASHPLAP